MPTILLRAEPGDRPPEVLLVEEPELAERAAALLEGGQEQRDLISDHRGLAAFRGRWDGRPVTIQATGLGAPATAMVVEELLTVGARTFVRVAPAMALASWLRVGDAVVAVAASAADGTSQTYLGHHPLAPVADFGLTNALVDGARGVGLNVDTGGVATVDVLPDGPGRRDLAMRGILAVDLASAPLFVLAARADAQARSTHARIRAGAILWIDRSATEEEPGTDDALPARLLRVALGALIGGSGP